MSYINLDRDNIDNEHICCAFSDKKCVESYNLKKKWLKNEFDNGYVFRRLDERAKVFIEYGPVEKSWIPVAADNYLVIGCFWVSGKYKKNGHGKALLQYAIDEAKKQGKDGLVAVVGTKKYHFMSDTKWFLKNGFEPCESISSGFSLLSLDINKKKIRPVFNDSVKSGECPDKDGYVVYYSNRCPFSEYHVTKELVETMEKRRLKVKIVKLETMEQAQCAPSPATIFSLFYNGKFITTDIGACLDSRFDKIMDKYK